MPIPTSLAGLRVGPVTHEVDRRWTMAYAAGLGDHNPRYLDTTHHDDLVAHPLFPVCPEWSVIVDSRSASEDHGVAPEETITGVHATHDLVIHRLVRPGDTLRTELEIVGVVNKTPGALTTTRLTTVDAAGRLVATTTQDAFYLGVPAEGEDHPDRDWEPVPEVQRIGAPTLREIPLTRGAAHIYTECARIWNPIHTDPEVARRAGLHDIILHGTANLAHGVTAVVDLRTGGDPHRIRRIRGRFAAMVDLPSSITVAVWPEVRTDDRSSAVPFEVRNAEGRAAVADGLAVLAETG